jgi:hypothetical protein
MAFELLTTRSRLCLAKRTRRAHSLWVFCSSAKTHSRKGMSSSSTQSWSSGAGDVVLEGVELAPDMISRRSVAIWMSDKESSSV